MPGQLKQEDHAMPDAPAQASGAVNEDNGITPPRGSESRVRSLPGATDTAASFEFLNEDHTMGNALRYIIMKNPEVEFCGYSIPHPAEAKMSLRIQTYEGTTVWEALEKGLDDLMDLCNVVEEKFLVARDQFVAKEAKGKGRDTGHSPESDETERGDKDYVMVEDT